jgi:hypothetical protein
MIKRLRQLRTRHYGVAQLTVVAMTAVAALTALLATASSASIGPDGSGGVVVDAGYLRLGMDATGTVISLTDNRNGQNYIATGHGAAPLVSLVVGGQKVKPTALSLNGTTLVFTNAAAGTRIDVAVEDKTTYTTFAVTGATASQGADVQTVLWGPLPLSISDTIGESAGIVRNSTFAVGLKPLNERTEGTWPRDYPTWGWQNEVDPNPSSLQVDDSEKWSAAGRTPWGTVLRAFTFDYRQERLRMNDYGYRIPVGPLPSGGSVVGSKIALFGTTPDTAPTVLSYMASENGLPYPTIHGQWQKTAQATSKSFLVLSDLNTSNVSQAAGLATSGGLDTIYSLPGSNGPWQSAGHNQFNSSFGSSDAGAANLVAQAKSAGVNVGVHTLSDFIDTNDSYVSPTPSPDLAFGQRTTLTRAIGSNDTTLDLTSCTPLAAGVEGNRLLIGSEFISYTGSSMVGSECRVTGLSRGQWGTAAASHGAGVTAYRVPQNSYQGAFGGLNLINAISSRYATTWNTTGISAMSFDGLESAAQAGWGAYGMARMVNNTVQQLNNKDGFISETSRMSTNSWDALSRASWGEVGVTSMNQVLVNNAFYQANYLPGMLGWISLRGDSNPQTIEDILARGAGLNAGAGFQSSVSSLAGGGQNTTALLNTVKQWETARNRGAFTPAQRAQLRDTSTHWHLSVLTAGQSWTLQQRDASGNNVGSPQTVSVPSPGFLTAALPGMTAGQLYEARIVSNVPTAIRYTVTAGALPTGLRLNADTGGITGVPATGTAATFTITATGAPGTGNAQQSFTIGAPANPAPGPLNLSTAFNNVGITSQSATATGNFDGAGNSFSAQQLAAAGAGPGAAVSVLGTGFTWPNVVAGTADNVAGGSAAIQGNGRGGSALAFLGSEAGDVSGTVTVTYTDGSTTTGSIGFPNWLDTDLTKYGAAPAISTQGRNTAGGYANADLTYRVYHNKVAIDPTRTIATITLPADSRIHIFAITATAPATTNKALNRPVTASSTEAASLAASYAVDGSATTRWSSQFADPQWIQVDLGSPMSVSRVVLRWETAYGSSYQIQTSADAINWSAIYSTTIGDGGVDDLTVSGTGRYVRLYGSARGTGWGYSLFELEIY